MTLLQLHETRRACQDAYWAYQAILPPIVDLENMTEAEERALVAYWQASDRAADASMLADGRFSRAWFRAIAALRAPVRQ